MMATRNTPSATQALFARLRSGLLIAGQALGLAPKAIGPK